ncbi:MAG TPA: ABC transporter substrate-binding protein [Candidatus Dormibacteraeota bacterium]|jgi:peptide/nickel transport system substrate-binding protein|nr:ABC transporter substrate-binding protein [Candidatus Dormibacteraeota bacterium]
MERPLPAGLTRRDLLRWGGGAGAVALAAPLLAARGSIVADAATRGGKSGGTFTGAFDEGPGGLPEMFNVLTATAGATFTQMHYSPLISYSPDFRKMEGDLARSWSVAGGGAEYTFSLRKGVTWHDGKPFTSADVKFTLELAINPDSAATAGSYLPPISSIDTPDDHTAVVHLQAPNVTFLATLTLLPMLPEHALSQYSATELVKSEWWYKSPIGTGPFRFTSYTPGQFSELAAFNRYWRGKPKIAKIVNSYFSDPASSVIALRKKTVEYDYLSLDDLSTFQGQSSFKILEGSSQVTNFLSWNFKDPRFTHLAVRQAFMYAIDRKTIIKELYKGGATLVNGPFDNPEYRSSGEDAYAYNPKKARQLLQSANWDSIKGAPIQIVTYYTDQLSASVLTAIQQMLAKVGITTTIRELDSASFASEEQAHKLTMMFAGLTNGPDPDVTRQAYISSGTDNYMAITVPELDRLYTKGRSVAGTQRAAVYQEISKVVSEQLPVAPMWVAKRYGGITSNVRNFVWSPVSNAFYNAGWQNWTVG